MTGQSDLTVPASVSWPFGMRMSSKLELPHSQKIHAYCQEQRLIRSPRGDFVWQLKSHLSGSLRIWTAMRLNTYDGASIVLLALVLCKCQTHRPKYSQLLCSAHLNLPAHSNVLGSPSPLGSLLQNLALDNRTSTYSIYESRFHSTQDTYTHLDWLGWSPSFCTQGFHQGHSVLKPWLCRCKHLMVTILLFPLFHLHP